MKNKRNVLIAFILICCLCLSIGYAAITDTLVINGTSVAGVDNPNNDETPDDDQTPVEKLFDEKLGFTASEVGTNSEGVTITGNAASYPFADTVSFSASGFDAVNETAVITFTITNASTDYDASIAVPTLTWNNPTTNANADYFEVTTDWGNAAKVVSANNGTTTVTVTVKLIKLPDENKSGDFSLTFKATAQEPNA